MLSASSATNKKTQVCAPPLAIPFMNRDSTKCIGRVPKVKNSQPIYKFYPNEENDNELPQMDTKTLTNCGNPTKKSVCLVPISVTMYPHKKLPKTAPGAATHPIHDISSVEIAPVFNGVAAD